ncbi:MAG: hypothetical protein HOB63_01760, partial [Opitutae bacterium]|nr:hypothetical protein [Opitutae bacterium]
LEFSGGEDAETLGIDGTETFSLPKLGDDLVPGEEFDLVIRKSDGAESSVKVLVRVDTGIEVQYYRHGGILPYVLRKLISEST